MKVLILLLSISLAVDGFIEETFDFGEGETLTMRMEDENDGLLDREGGYPTSTEYDKLLHIFFLAKNFYNFNPLFFQRG